MPHWYTTVCVCGVCTWSYILYADGEVGLEVIKVLCQLVAMVIVGEKALKKCQQLQEEEKNRMKVKIKKKMNNTGIGGKVRQKKLMHMSEWRKENITGRLSKRLAI